MSFFVVVFLKRMSYNKETKQAENERSQNKDKKAITPDSAPDPKILPKKSWTVQKCASYHNQL